MDIKKLVMGSFLMLFVLNFIVPEVSAIPTDFDELDLFGKDSLFYHMMDGLFGAGAPSIKFLQFEGPIGLLFLEVAMFAGLLYLLIGRWGPASEKPGAAKALSIAAGAFLAGFIGNKLLLSWLGKGIAVFYLVAVVAIFVFAWSMLGTTFYKGREGYTRAKAGAKGAETEEEQAKQAKDEAEALRRISKAEYKSLEAVKKGIESASQTEITNAMKDLDSELAKEARIMGVMGETLNKADRLLQAMKSVKTTSRTDKFKQDLKRMETLQQDVEAAFEDAELGFRTLREDYVLQR